MRGTLGVYRELLHNGPLTRLLAGEFISSVGDWLYLVALLIVVDEQTGDPVLLGIVGGLRVLPYVVLSIPAGIAADRFDRRLILIVTDLMRGAIMVALAMVVATGSHWVALVALSTLATCFSAFFGPTIGAYLPMLARDERELGPANSVWSTLDNLAFIIGPALAFLLIAALDLTLAFVLNAVSFAICAAFLWGLPSGRPMSERSFELDGDGSTAASDVSSGPAAPDRPTIRGFVRPLSGLLVIGTVAAFVFGGIGILTVILADDVYGAGSEATGLLNAAIGVGGLVGAILSGALVVRRRLAAPFLGGTLALGVGVALLGLIGGIGPALVAMAILAAGDLVLEVVNTTIFQRLVPDELRGRTLGVLETIVTLAYALGSFALPIIAVGLGIGPVLAVCGIAIVASGGVAVVLLGSAATSEPAALPIPVRRLAGLAVFAGVPAARLDDVLGRLASVEVRAGDVVIREGDAADRFYIIDSGAFEVTQLGPDGNPRPLRTMGPDEVFGEIGLLTGRPRTATVTALVDGRLLALAASDFADLVSAGPGLMNRLLDLHRGAAAGRTEAGQPTPVSSG
ncbi:MAG TPA: MFS transporter [Candidatus Limnocylindrales bacterium]|nr:MFS transporter [Candidatus Limnocylindrales bacterium]